MQHLVSNEDFELLRKRWLKTTQKHLDPRLVTTLSRFNQIKGLVTVFSCSGHTLKEIEKNPELCTDNEIQIIFVINKEGQRFYDVYRKWLDQLSSDKWVDFRPSLSFDKLAWPLRVNGPSLKLYNAHILTFSYFRNRHDENHAKYAVGDLLDFYFKHI